MIKYKFEKQQRENLRKPYNSGRGELRAAADGVRPVAAERGVNVRLEVRNARELPVVKRFVHRAEHRRHGRERGGVVLIALRQRVRLRDVDEAQALMVNLAKDLAAKGEIMLTKNRADDELVY